MSEPLLTEPVDRLALAADGVYRAFASYPYRPAMPACAHCVTDEDLLALGHGPVRELPADLLGRYARKAVSTWGEVVDFKRLLPRLLELTAANQLPVPPIIVTAKLTRAEWSTWPAEERAPVWQYLLAWWHHNTAEWTGPGRAAHHLLAVIAAAESDLSPYLSDWQHLLAGMSPGRAGAVRHLMELLCNSDLRPDAPETIQRLFWDPAGDAGAQLEAWLLDPVIAEELERALADMAHSKHARRLAVAFARLRRFQDAVAAARGEARPERDGHGQIVAGRRTTAPRATSP